MDDDGRVVVTTAEAALKAQTVEREYDISDLSAGAATAADYVKMIEETVDPDSWSSARGKPAGTIKHEDGKLVVTQTKDNHRLIAKLLETLREAADPRFRKLPADVGGDGL